MLPEDRLEDVFEDAPVGYVSTDRDGLLLRVNRTLLGWTGYEAEELLGRKRLYDLLAPGAKIYHETHYAPLLHLQGAVREIAVELLRADGTRLPVLLNSTLVADADGEPVEIRTTVFDATERRRYERELLRARADAEDRARAALALEHVNEAVLLVGPTGRIEVANRAAAKIFGEGAEPGRAADALPGWAPLVARIPLSGPRDSPRRAVLPLVHEQERRWLETAGVETGEGVVYTIRDVTSEQELEQLRRDVVAVVSHELRTPLTGALGAAQTLLARFDELPDDDRRGLLDMIVGQGERLQRIIDQMLLSSELDEGVLDTGRAVFDAAALVRRLPTLLAEAEGRARVVVEAVDPARAVGDEERAAQVLVNLVDNSLKYTQGSVRIHVARAGDAVRITVTDEGPGIPPAEHERVFERFYRLDPALSRGVGGTGLGLYIARELVARMRGRIELFSRGAGTTVVVELPAAPED